jgi:hypothetical protein
MVSLGVIGLSGIPKMDVDGDPPFVTQSVRGVRVSVIRHSVSGHNGLVLECVWLAQQKCHRKSPLLFASIQWKNSGSPCYLPRFQCILRDYVNGRTSPRKGPITSVCFARVSEINSGLKSVDLPPNSLKKFVRILSPFLPSRLLMNKIDDAY